MVLPLRLQWIQPDPKARPLIFNQELSQVLLGLERLVRPVGVSSNIGNTPQQRHHLTEDPVFGFNLQAITSK